MIMCLLVLVLISVKDYLIYLDEWYFPQSVGWTCTRYTRRPGSNWIRAKWALLWTPKTDIGAYRLLRKWQNSTCIYPGLPLGNKNRLIHRSQARQCKCQLHNSPKRNAVFFIVIKGGWTQNIKYVAKGVVWLTYYFELRPLAPFTYMV